MKKILLAITVTMLLATSFAQKITKLTLSNKGIVEVISLEIDDNVILNITEDGSIIKWGFELFSSRNQNYADYTDKLEEYAGRVEYYSANDNEAFRGKVKYIGKTRIVYYASYDEEALVGKVKFIGASPVVYYKSFEDKVYTGKIKSLGPVLLTYYGAFDNEALRGKLKSLGATGISYYSSVDDKAIVGKVKSIGQVSYTYYTSYDRPEYRGAMKSGSQIQNINGVKYYVKN